MFKGAIVGFGKVVEAAHAPAFRNLRSELKIEAVADERPERLELAAKLLPGIRTYQKAEEMYARESGLDFVVIATPPSSHAALTVKALEKGFHVLVEKPLALELSDLEAIKRASLAAARTVFTVDNWKHAPGFLALREVVEAGTLGEIRHLELHTIRTQPAQAATAWRAGEAASGGLLVDHGWHAFYLLRHLSGLEPTGVACRQRSSGDEVTMLVELGESTGLVHLTWAGTFRSNWAIVFGTKGSAELRDDKMIVRTAEGEKRTSFPQKVSAGSAHPDWFETMLPDFLQEMKDPARRGRNLEEAQACLHLLDRARATLTEANAP